MKNMFGKLREKLKSWFKKSKDKIDEKEEKEIAKQVDKAEKIIEEAKYQDLKKIPIKFDELKRKTEPDINKIKEEVEKIKKDIKEEREIKKFEEELKKADKLIEKTKKENIQETPLTFNPGTQKFEPDIDKLKEENTGFFSRLVKKFSHKISKEEFENIFEDLELLLLENNVALEAVEKIKEILSKKLIGKEIKKDKLEQEIKEELKKTLNEILIEPDNPLDIIKISKKPFKILFFGINGTGKTTSIAKIANFLKKSGFSIVLAAADTFRAASIEQISEHSKKLGVKLIKQDYGADPAAVCFDAVKYAESHKIDVVLIDTAGRMHTKKNLLSEMEKIVRVIKPNLKIFVAESIAGNDAVEQARAFNEMIDIDGVILSKADIDEKGGTIISVSYAIKKPIFYLGIGQYYDDLQLFNKNNFINSLLS